MAEIQRSFAVIIGINQYLEGIPALKTAVNDATQLAHVLESKYQYQVLQLLDTAATSDKINQLLTAFEQQILPLSDGSHISINKNDRFFFYFAGHGIALDDLDNANGPTGFLVPQDARMDIEYSLLPMKRLHDALLKLPCRHLLVILDCCFAGAFRWAGHRNAIRQQKIYQERYERFMSGCAQQVITSTADDEKAADSFYRFGQRVEHEGHSPFAEALLKGLEGEADINNNGIITATELYVYLHNELLNTYPQQTPGFCQLQRHDKGEYIFVIPDFDAKQLTPAPSLQETNNPYRGLESFEEEHSALFFGRKPVIAKLQEFVNTHPLTVVLGASGSGKSSLVKAGLIPQLRQNPTPTLPTSSEGVKSPFPPACGGTEGGSHWRILAPMRPGESPFNALNKTLIKENLPIFSRPNVTFEQELQALASSVKAWSEANPDTKLLLVIDQLEELVTLCRNDGEREKFLSGLARAIAAFPQQLRVVVTLRSDFEAQFHDTPLEPYWTTARFVVPAMTREELRSSIVEPATARVLYFEPLTLVDQLIDEVIQMPGALPLLSFTLRELYLKYIRSAKEGKRNNRVITQKDYEELGGVTRSLTQRADYEYDRLVKSNPRLAQTIKHVMLRMIVIGGAELSRRRVLCQELEYEGPENTRVKTVIERFVAARLLVKGRDLENNEYIEPAHDALVRGWQKLLNWERQELTSVLLQRELMAIANRWATQRQNKQAVGFLWDNDPRLPLVQKSLQSNSSWLNSVESEFVKHSIQKKRHNRRRTVGVVTGFMAFIIPLQFSPLNLLPVLIGGTSPVIGTKPCTYNQLSKKIGNAQPLIPNP